MASQEDHQSNLYYHLTSIHLKLCELSPLQFKFPCLYTLKWIFVKAWAKLLFRFLKIWFFKSSWNIFSREITGKVLNSWTLKFGIHVVQSLMCSMCFVIVEKEVGSPHEITTIWNAAKYVELFALSVRGILFNFVIFVLVPWIVRIILQMFLGLHVLGIIMPLLAASVTKIS